MARSPRAGSATAERVQPPVVKKGLEPDPGRREQVNRCPD